MGQFPSYTTESETIDGVTELIVDTEHSEFKGWENLKSLLPEGREFKLTILNETELMEREVVRFNNLQDFLLEKGRQIEKRRRGVVLKPKSASPKRERVKLGDSCGCGSGVTYKKCCRAKRLKRKLKR